LTNPHVSLASEFGSIEPRRFVVSPIFFGNLPLETLAFLL